MIVNSLLDADFYKFTMMQFAFHFQPERLKMAEYSMKCRSGIDLRPYANEIKTEVEHWKKLRLSDEELFYLRELKIDGHTVFKDDFIEFLRGFHLDDVEIVFVEENEQLNIRVKGDWKYSILAEIAILAIVQEVYWKHKLSGEEYNEREIIFQQKLKEKFEYIVKTEVKFADFGTRRRFSCKKHEEVIKAFKGCKNFLGTSNMLFAMKYDVPPIGSNAHEFFQAMQALGTSFEASQSEAIRAWAKEYPHILKVILTDILGIEMFFKDCDAEMANHYTAFRQDSGIPKEIGYKIKNWLESYGIDPKTKSVLFSDDLNFEKDNELEIEFRDIFKSTPFGNGTFLTNDMGLKPISLVMKIVRMNGIDVIKLSDSPGKVMCENQSVIDYTERYVKNRLGK